ncbi:Polyubiquitin (Fragment) [Seminavis robusta]|uniref:Polyubiquitin n=1 Tax=Seminavis robusta TaxID=568900 RepID=A0A9N8DSM2_9STRA
MVTRSKSPKPNDNAVKNESNPLRSDPELCGLLKRLDKIKKYKTFNRWKTKFLNRLDGLIYQKGMDPAERTTEAFNKLVKKTVVAASKVTNHIEKGELSSEKKTVKASLSLSELSNNLTTTVEKLEELIPSTGKDEKKLGYTKYHLGAVLIRQGFHQYITLKAIEDALTGIAEKVADVADRQQLELFEYYKTKFQRFCDIMADLNMYEIMMKCVEFQEAPDPEESSDEEPIMIELAVEGPDGKTQIIKLEVDPSDTLGSIKESIADDIGIPVDKQIVKFKGKELPDNNMTVGKAGLQDGSKLTVEPLKIPITVKTYDGKTIKLMVDPATYLSDIKRKVEPESGVPAQNQRLFLDKKELDNDNQRADDAGIKANTVLYMEPKSIKLNVEMPDGSKVEVEVSPSDTTDDLKQKIEEETGMKVPEQILKQNGKDLPAGKKLKDLGIKDGDDVQVAINKVPVKVQTKDGKTVEIMVAPDDTLADIKKQLEAETGLPFDQQELTMDGKPLTGDKKTARDMGIKAGTTLKLDAKAITITVELTDGTKHVVKLDALDSKSAIEKSIGKTGLAKFLTINSGTLELDTNKIFGKK